MKFLRLALVGCVAVLAVTAASAQSGGITVLVVDGEGLPLPGATVTISHELNYVKETASLTDKRGLAEFPVLKPGAGYQIAVSFPGFSEIREAGLRVRINENLKIPIKMIEEFQERVKVVAERDVIDLESTEAATKFSENFIQDLPVPGRFYQNVLTMAPGVQDADGDGNVNVHGSRARDFSAMVSGTRNVDPLTGQWMSRVNPNSIEEMEVITAGAGVEFGRAQGGFANIIQKQGSNTFEGVFEFYLRTSKLDGDGANNISALPDQDFDVIQPLTQLSGPVVKDKLWFRLSHEYRNTDIPLVIPGALEVTTVQEWTHSDQLTWQVSDRNKLAFIFEADPQRIANAGVNSFRRAESAFSTKRNGETYKVVWDAPYSPKVLVKSTFAWQDLNRGQTPNTSGILNDCAAGNDVPGWIQGAQCFDLDSGVFSGSGSGILDSNSQRLSVNSTATLFGGRFWGMSHQFKLGLTVENERYFRNLNIQPAVTTYIVQTIEDDPSNPDPPDPVPEQVVLGRISVPSIDDSRATGTNWGIFLEDQFKPRQNLTVTLGVRLDREELNSEGHLTFGENTPILQREAYEAQLAAGVPITSAYWPAFVGYEGFELFEREMTQLLCSNDPLPGQCAEAVEANLSVAGKKTGELYNLRSSEDVRISNTNFSPRLAVSWSPWSNGKTAFKLTAGRLYNLIPLTIPVQELNPALTTVEYRQRGDMPWEREGNRFVVDLTTVSRDLKTPYQDEVTFAIERELWAETSVSLRYVTRKYRDQIQDVDINKDVGDFGHCRFQIAAPTSGSPHPWIAPSPVSPSNGFASTVSSSFSVDPCPAGICPPGVMDDWLTDPYTGLRYPDTRPGNGDGWDSVLRTSLPSTPGYNGFDDCTGEFQVVQVTDPGGGLGAVTQTQLRRPDTIADLYTQNPFFGDVFEVGNYNESDYEAFVLELVRRQYRSWELQGSYTWSESRGDGEDFFQALGDDPSLRNNVFGFQSNDVRHSVKVNATTITPWGIRLGTALSWQSGYPYSILFRRFSFDSLPPSFEVGGLGGRRGRIRDFYPTGIRNDQRNSSYWNVDLKATKELNLGKGMNMQLSAEVFNLLDDGTYQIYNGQFGQQVNGNNQDQYRFGRRWQVGMKMSF